VALKLIEKDVHEKQDQLISLRKQLDEIKSVNIKLQDDIKVSIIIFTVFDCRAYRNPNAMTKKRA